MSIALELMCVITLTGVYVVYLTVFVVVVVVVVVVVEVVVVVTRSDIPQNWTLESCMGMGMTVLPQ